MRHESFVVVRYETDDCPSPNCTAHEGVLQCIKEDGHEDRCTYELDADMVHVLRYGGLLRDTGAAQSPIQGVQDD